MRRDAGHGKAIVVAPPTIMRALDAHTAISMQTLPPRLGHPRAEGQLPGPHERNPDSQCTREVSATKAGLAAQRSGSTAARSSVRWNRVPAVMLLFWCPPVGLTPCQEQERQRWLPC